MNPKPFNIVEWILDQEPFLDREQVIRTLHLAGEGIHEAVENGFEVEVEQLGVVRKGMGSRALLINW